MNENLNLVEILKNVPQGTRLYCTLYGEVILSNVNNSRNDYPIEIRTSEGIERFITENGKFNQNLPDGECLLFPSKDQRDWSKFKLDYPVDTPMMVNGKGGYNSNSWHFKYYAGNGKCFNDGKKSIDGEETSFWDYTVPVSEFNFDDLESNKAKSIV